jgi:hypothetical protein
MSPEAKFDALDEWVRAGGGTVSGVCIRKLPSGERGLFASRALSPGEAIIRLPTALLLTGKRARAMPHVARVLAGAAEDELAESLGELGSSDPDTIAMVLFLIAARIHMGDATGGIDYADGMSSWIECLPDAFYTPVTASEDFMAHRLDRSMVLAMAGSVRDELQEIYTSFIVPYAIKRFPDDFPADKVTYEVFLWAHCVTASRAFGFGARLARGVDDCESEDDAATTVDDGLPSDVITPYADMMNHACDVERVSVTAGKWTVTPAAPEMPDEVVGFQMCVGERQVPGGEQLLISYGNLENAELLLHYGFAEVSNPRDRIKMTLAEPDDPVSLLTKKCMLLEMANCGNLGFHHALSAPAPMPMELVASVRLLCMDEEEAASVTIRTDFRQPVSARNERVTVETLKDMACSMQCTVDNLSPDEEKNADVGLVEFGRSCDAYMSSSQAILAASVKVLCGLERAIPRLEIASTSL